MKERGKMIFDKKMYDCIMVSEKLGKKRASVHYDEMIRFDKAKKESGKDIVEVNDIIKLTNEFLIKIGLDKVDKPIRNSYEIENNDDKTVILPYESIQRNYNLNNEKHIIWMKFAYKNENKKERYLGVVARSNDVNFQIPNNTSEYNLKNGKRWKYNTSGIIIHMLGMKWDESFVLVFPISNVGDHAMKDVECGIGQYLISKNVPILDYYSHTF